MAKKKKVEVASVMLWGKEVGSVAWDETRGVGVFEYTGAFAGSGLEISPLRMPLASGRLYQFPELNRSTFQGLPGLLADSLPDHFGNTLINQWLARQGRSPEDFSPVERLCYMGTRAMGALEFAPALMGKAKDNPPLEVEELVALANEIMQSKGELSANFMKGREKALDMILRVGTSAGGARAKAVIAFNPVTEEVRSGQLDMPSGFEPWLLKFDGVSDNQFNQPQGYGRIEYAYYRMAKSAGVEMEDCRLLPDREGRAHFMTRRFDRSAGNEKMHMQSLCGLGHYDFNQAGAYGYEAAFEMMRILGMGYDRFTQLYRRMVFNVLARNQDDHTRNLSFLMDRNGVWDLAPAYDVMWSYDPKSKWVSRYQMSINGRLDAFTVEDLLAVAENAGVKKAKDILHKVGEAVAHWPDFAAEASVPDEFMAPISESHRLDLVKDTL